MSKNSRVKVGDNSLQADVIKGILDRVETLRNDRAAVNADIQAVFAEAKANGYDTKVLRDLLKIRAKDPNEHSEHNCLMRLYGELIGVDPFS